MAKVITVFRSRLRPEAQAEYMQWAGRMKEIATKMPGYIEHKSFVAEDGERVTIVAFESEEKQRAWSLHPEHVEAKKAGRDRFYLEYSIQVCGVQRESSFRRGEGGSGRSTT